MSNGFSGSSTRKMGKFERELESRSKKLDIFTDDFQPPGSFEKVPGTSVDKANGGYSKPHDDEKPEADSSFVRNAAAGRPEDQEPMDALDRVEQRYQAKIKPPEDQFPIGKVLKKLAAGVDETIWSKAKDASQEAFGKIKWPFVMWWYENHGGK